MHEKKTPSSHKKTPSFSEKPPIFFKKTAFFQSKMNTLEINSLQRQILFEKALNKSAFCSNNSPFYFLERAFYFGKSAFGFAVRKSCETFIRLCVWFCSLFGSKGRLLCRGGRLAAGFRSLCSCLLRHIWLSVPYIGL